MSLYELERTGDVQELIGYLRRSDAPRTRARAAEMLGGFPDHEDRGDVVAALVDVADPADGEGDEVASDEVAAAAVDALDELGGDALERLVLGSAGVDGGADGAERVKARAFADALGADRPELRMAAANALGDLGVEECVPRLVDSLRDPDPRVRARAARACGRTGDPRAVDGLRERLRDERAPVRVEAANALGTLGTRGALDALLPLYADDSERVRRVAVGAFGNFDTAAPVEYLVAALADEAAAVRRTAVFSLVELLANVPTDRSHEIRETVVETLAETDDPTVVVPLVEILEEGRQVAQRRNTAWLLGRMGVDAGRERVVDALVETLRDEDATTRQFAATSLVELGADPLAVGRDGGDSGGHSDGADGHGRSDGDLVEDRLLDVLDDASAPVEARAQAVFALGAVGGERSRRRLEALVEADAAEAVQQRAAAALSKLEGRA